MIEKTTPRRPAKKASQSAIEQVTGPDEELKATQEALHLKTREADGARMFARGLFNKMADSVCIIDLQGRFFDVNRAFLAMTGFQREDVVGLPVLELTRRVTEPALAEKIAGEIKKGLAGNPADALEIPFKPLNQDHEMVFSISNTLVRDAEGKPRWLVSISRDITEQRRAEEALRLSEQRFRTMFQAPLIGVVVSDKEGKFLECNPRFQQILGYSERELRSMSFREITHPDDMEESLRLVNEVREGRRESFGMEKRYRTKDGRVIWGRVEVCAIHGGNRGELFHLAVMDDVTERKQAEFGLRMAHRSQSSLNALLNMFLQPIALEEILDRAIDYIVSLPWLTQQRKGAIFLVEDEPGVLVMKAQRALPRELLRRCARVPFGHCLCGQAAASGTLLLSQSLSSHHDVLYKGIAPHGHYCVPITSSGRVLGVVNLYVEEGHQENQAERDFLQALADALAGMIDRRRAEEEERRSEQKFHSLVNNIRVGIFRSTPDPDGKFLEVNPAMEGITGYSKRELLGMKVVDLYVHPEQREAALQAGALGTPTEIEFRRKDGSIIVVLDAKTLVRDQAGKPLYFDGILEDITVRKRLEDTLKTLYEKERSEHQELQESARARAQFVNVLAHEVKTPLTPLLGSARLLAEQFPPSSGSTQERLMRNILTAADTLEARISELLDLAQLQAGFLPLHVTTVDVLSLLKEMRDQFQPLAEKKNLSFESNLPVRLPPVLADGRRLEQVLMNILTNAVKYSPAGGFIRFTAGVDGKDLLFTCSNSGPVISAEEQVRIFQPYYRREADRNHLPGSGIGLALCKELVEAHGGRLWVESGSAEGNTFGVALPLDGPAPNRITKLQDTITKQ